MNQPTPLACTVFLFASFVLAGVAQTIWFKSRYASRWKIPLDGGRTIRGRRLFGDHKTWSGFVVMVPATGVSFLLVSTAWRSLPGIESRLWTITPAAFFLLGVWAGFWFMVGELPNSFLKRRYGISPGEPAPPGALRTTCFVLDQVDSVLAALLALAVLVPVPLAAWVLVLVMGGLIHWLFNVLLMLIGLKARAA